MTESVSLESRTKDLKAWILCRVNLFLTTDNPSLLLSFRFYSRDLCSSCSSCSYLRMTRNMFFSIGKSFIKQTLYQYASQPSLFDHDSIKETERETYTHHATLLNPNPWISSRDAIFPLLHLDSYMQHIS